MADEQAQDPTLADRWAALKASPLGQAGAYVADAASPLTNEIGAMGNNAVDLGKAVGSGINTLTGGALAPGGSSPSAPAVAPPQQAAPQVGPPLPPGMGPEGAPPAAPPPPKPVTPQQQQALHQIGKKAEDSIGPDGLINTEQVKNDLATLALDDQQKANALKAVNDANDHIRVASAIGAQQARDATGADYWENASTGMKVLRVLGGIVTLGGSEKYIAAQIQKKVAKDQSDLATEDNIYKTMVDAGKTREQALSIDTAKQAHIYQLGLDRIAAAHPSPLIQQKVAALKAGLTKEASTAIAGFYKQQEDNKVAQQNANTSSFNAQTERMKADAERGKAGAPTILRDTAGNVIGHTDTPDQAKQIQAQQLSVEGLDRLASHVKSYSWTDKFTPSARAAAAADYSQAMQLVNMYRASHPNEESSRQMEVLQKSIPNPSELTTSPTAYRTGFNSLLNQMKLSLVASKKQSGI